MRKLFFKVSDTSSLEDTSIMEDLRSEEKNIEEKLKSCKVQPSYIEEISTLIAESSNVKVVK